MKSILFQTEKYFWTVQWFLNVSLRMCTIHRKMTIHQTKPSNEEEKFDDERNKHNILTLLHYISLSLSIDVVL